MKAGVLYESIYDLAGLLAKANEEFRGIWIPMKAKPSKNNGHFGVEIRSK